MCNDRNDLNQVPCWYSQYDIYKNSNNNKTLVIVEDDAIFSVYNTLFNPRKNRHLHIMNSNITTIKKNGKLAIGKDGLIHIYRSYIKNFSSEPKLLIILDSDFDMFYETEIYKNLKSNNHFLYHPKYSIENYYGTEPFFKSLFEEAMPSRYIDKIDAGKWLDALRRCYVELLPSIVAMQSFNDPDIIKYGSIINSSTLEIFNLNGLYKIEIKNNNNLYKRISKFNSNKTQRPIFNKKLNEAKDSIKKNIIDKNLDILDFVPGKLLIDNMITLYNYTLSLFCNKRLTENCRGNECHSKYCSKALDYLTQIEGKQLFVNMETDDFIRRYVRSMMEYSSDIHILIDQVTQKK